MLLDSGNLIRMYDRQQTWLWNLQNGPAPKMVDPHPRITGCDWRWCGMQVASPLGIPAGPLLNSGWLLHYAALGFDILVYKTVRSCATKCYELPNLVPVATNPLLTAGTTVPESPTMEGSWAVSFGMPSVAPEDWRRDIERARRMLPAGKALVVSVVGTQDSRMTNGEESLVHLAHDFAQCAGWAVDSGAHGVEANFSCPNVTTSDGQLYQQPTAAAFVAKTIRQNIGDAPLVLKIGHVATKNQCLELVNAVAPFVSGLAMTNSIAARVHSIEGSLLFAGHTRGICGEATREASLAQVAMFAEVVADVGCPLDIIGVGGIANSVHVDEYLAAGATSIGIATAAMTNPEVAMEIRKAKLADNSIWTEDHY